MDSPMGAQGELTPSPSPPPPTHTYLTLWLYRYLFLFFVISFPLFIPLHALYSAFFYFSLKICPQTDGNLIVNDNIIDF
jgi:hypothetical protein